MTALICAAYKGIEGMLAALLERGANPNIRDSAGCTALHWAVEWNNPAALTLLLKTGKCDTPLKDKQGRTALSLAQKKGRHACIAVLEKYNANGVDFGKWSVVCA